MAGAFAGLAVAALLVPAGLVALGAVALAGAAAADAWTVRRPPAVRRSAPAVLARGTPAPLTVTVRPDRGARRVDVRQPLPPELDLDRDEAPGALATMIRGPHRGRHVLPPVAVRCTGPLGLGRVDHRVGEATEVTVYPDLPAGRALARAVRSGLARDLAVLSRGALGLGTELERVRDYLPDDDLRQVNWKATARLARPMSNEYRLDEDRDVICLVDCGRLMAAPLTGVGRLAATRLDAGLDAATAVVMVADAVGDRSGAVAFDAVVRRRVAPRRHGGRAVVDALFDLEPSARDSDALAAFHAVGGGKRACVMVFTDLLDPAAARNLVEAVPVVARHHAVVVATAVDDEVARLLRTPPSVAFDTYAAAVAVDVIEARSAAAAALQRAGAVVVDVPAGQLGRACVGAYLRLKARARV